MKSLGNHFTLIPNFINRKKIKRLEMSKQQKHAFQQQQKHIQSEQYENYINKMDATQR